MEIIGSAIFTTFVVQIMSSCKIENDFYDLYNEHYTFPKEYTDTIDDILIHSGHGIIKYKQITGEKSYIPYHGKHYFYQNKDKKGFFNRMFITLEKKEKDIDGKMVDVYHCYVAPFRNKVFTLFLTKLFEKKQPKKDENYNI